LLSTMVCFALLVLLICASIAAANIPWGYTPPVCKRANEVPRTDKGCWRTCADRNAVPDKNCEFHRYFPPLCQCTKGFYRADNGECVTYDQCASSKSVIGPFTFKPLICTGANEYASNADKSCERTCEGRDGPGICYAKLVFPGNCLCNGGFYRAENGECVTYEQCGQQTPATTVSPPSACPPNEGLSQSHKLCEPTCEHKNGPRTCPLIMIRHGHCLCKKDYYRAYTGECASWGRCVALGYRN
ncbi:hypothetical protein PRIPAC_89758, partial [Pristionchus pacificus]